MVIHCGNVPPRHDEYDCIVLGAGPAGCTVATLVAEYGHRVLLLERDRFPRHRIGESLMPQTYGTLKRLGLLDALKASEFPVKESVQFVTPDGRDSEPYFFTDRDPGEWSKTWQVRRDCFDQMMVNNARRRGAEVCEGFSVREVLFEDDRATGVEIDTVNGRRKLNAKVVVDATGQTGLIGRQRKLFEHDERLRNAAIYTYFRHAYRDEGRNAGATIIIHTKLEGGWFWYIPLNDDVTSVGLVASPDLLFTGRGGDPAEVFAEELKQCEGLSRRVEGAEQMEDVRVLRDFTYSSKQVAGDGWVLVGDAYSFIDPVYSSGVLLALKGGEMAADSIHQGLSNNDLSGATLGAHGQELSKGIAL
ncbi:MAG: NAD(P)/FAD-dependent oxidoreductase, partial [Phycisphaerae bacterium]